MSDFNAIVRLLDPRWAQDLRSYALKYEEERHEIRASWIPSSEDDDTWFDLYQMATTVEQDIALM
ncbi:hypothetical protein [Spirillospora albida]|uniref:hypothetical protein n=1 Tax=Spirillospora albida TaxID=58123 RepID=UPI0004C2941F|nr:hypothetical protein [Spirillospora albida]